MVKVEIVEEKDTTGSPYASSSSSRTSSSVSLSSVESDASVDETLFDRILALKDIVPPTTRHTISSRISKTASIFKRGSKLVGNVIWVLTTSTLLVGLPLALILEDESKAVAQEKEMLEQQQGAQQAGFFRHFYLLPFSYSTSPDDGSFALFTTWLRPKPAKSPRPTWFLKDLQGTLNYLRLFQLTLIDAYLYSVILTAMGGTSTPHLLMSLHPVKAFAKLPYPFATGSATLYDFSPRRQLSKVQHIIF
jgi:import receptor subunit TOM22